MFFETRHFVTVYNFSSIAFKVNNEWKTVCYWVVKVIRWDENFTNSKWYYVWSFFFDLFQDWLKSFVRSNT
ncbi:Uncharacterised protein [Mycobacterium tuberculosis]|nr:Uncharacterised protein [Mycobacterium tuberculosis]